MSGRALATSVLVAAGAAALAALFFACFEKRTLQIPTGLSEEASRDDYLAAGRLLEAMGHAVVRLDGPADLTALPPSDAVLLFTARRRTLSPERTASLRRWAESGGHLVVAHDALWTDGARADPLLAPLGLHAERVAIEIGEPEISAPEGAAPTDAEPETAEDAEAAEAPEPLALADFPGAPAPLQLHFPLPYVWREPDAVASVARAADDAGEHLLSVAMGAGRLSALTDDFFLRNEAIGEVDHAEALVRLVRLGDGSRTIWIVTGEHWPGVWSQLCDACAAAARERRGAARIVPVARCAPARADPPGAHARAPALARAPRGGGALSLARRPRRCAARREPRRGAASGRARAAGLARAAGCAARRAARGGDRHEPGARARGAGARRRRRRGELRAGRAHARDAAAHIANGRNMNDDHRAPSADPAAIRDAAEIARPHARADRATR